MGAKKKANTEAPRAVVVTTQRHFGKRRVLVLVVVVAVLLAAGWLLYVKFALGNDSDGQAQTPQQKRESTLKGVEELSEDRKYGEAASQLQTYLDSKPPEDIAEKEFIRLGVMYLNDKQFDKAISTFEAGLKSYPDSKFEATRSLGLAYLMRGDANGNNKDDYRKALTYYEQSKEMAQANPKYNHIVQSDESSIRLIQDKLAE